MVPRASRWLPALLRACPGSEVTAVPERSHPSPTHSGPGVREGALQPLPLSTCPAELLLLSVKADFSEVTALTSDLLL